MKDPNKMEEREALELRSKTSLDQNDIDALEPDIRSGNTDLSYWLMQRAWIAGAWQLLESLANLHVEIDPKSARPYLHLSFSLRQQGRIEEADNAILSAYSNCEDFASVEYETALMLAMEGRLVESRKHFANYVHLMFEQSETPSRVPKVDAIFAHFLRQHHLPIRSTFHLTQDSNN